MTSVAKRVAVVMAAAVVWAGASASPAAAGGVDANSGILEAAIYNVTPYTWTLVSQGTRGAAFGHPSTGDLHYVPKAQIVPGDASLFQIGSNAFLNCTATQWYGYDGYFTYAVDVLGGPTHYVTVGISGAWANGACPPYGQRDAYLDVYITSSPPDGNWDPANRTAPGPVIANPQLGYQHNVPQTYDQTIGVTGNWTVDASTTLGRAFDDVLNSVCNVGTTPPANSPCEFTQTGPLRWGAGAPVGGSATNNCANPSPDAQPVYSYITYSADQQASVSAGGGLSLATEGSLFGIVATTITVDVEAQTEWTDTGGFSRTAAAYLPPQNSGTIWTVPVIGTVTGTLVLKTGSATFTVTNFSETRSGVTRDNLTPAYADIVLVRPISAARLPIVCPDANSSRAATSAGATAKRVLFPGRGIAQVRLGQRRDARRLGRPLLKSPRSNRSATANDCRLLDQRCRMLPGRGGTWVYDGGLNVVFGADRRVSALFYSGRGRSAAGVGVGSSPRAVRAAYPGVSCEGNPRGSNCTLKGSYRSRAVNTVFHFTKKKGRLKCDRVMVYFVDQRSGETGA